VPPALDPSDPVALVPPIAKLIENATIPKLAVILTPTAKKSVAQQEVSDEGAQEEVFIVVLPPPPSPLLFFLSHYRAYRNTFLHPEITGHLNPTAKKSASTNVFILLSLSFPVKCGNESIAVIYVTFLLAPFIYI
jgi:hypothetical protein